MENLLQAKHKLSELLKRPCSSDKKSIKMPLSGGEAEHGMASQSLRTQTAEKQVGAVWSANVSQASFKNAHIWLVFISFFSFFFDYLAAEYIVLHLKVVLLCVCTLISMQKFPTAPKKNRKKTVTGLTESG